jgi:hypothetical protein
MQKPCEGHNALTSNRDGQWLIADRINDVPTCITRVMAASASFAKPDAERYSL